MRTARADSGNAPAPRRALRRMLVSMVLVAVAMGIVCFGVLSDRATVRDRRDLRDVALGAPWPWFHQDNRGWGPMPFPQQMSLESPWEHRTSLSLWVFLADVAVVLGLPRHSGSSVLRCAGGLCGRAAIVRPSAYLRGGNSELLAKTI
jgi:hypothetical protein